MGVLLCFKRKCSAANKHHSSEEGVRGRLLLLGIAKVTNAHRERIGHLSNLSFHCSHTRATPKGQRGTGERQRKYRSTLKGGKETISLLL